MANRRMFAKTIVQTSKFYKMTTEAKLLYYELGMSADDEGFVETYTPLMVTKSSGNELTILEENGFIKIIDDDVAYIVDWEKNNQIRNDRFTESKYHGLPLVNQMVPQYRLGKVRLDISDNKEEPINKYEFNRDDFPNISDEEFEELPFH